jgi:hypothetical protein
MWTASLETRSTDGLIILTVTPYRTRTRGFQRTSRFTTSAPELGAVDVFTKRATELQY